MIKIFFFKLDRAKVLCVSDVNYKALAELVSSIAKWIFEGIKYQTLVFVLFCD